MKFKAGVSVYGAHPFIWLHIQHASKFWNTHMHGLTITSMCDGKHSKHSDHYKGMAWDTRTWTTRDSGVQVYGDARSILFEKYIEHMGDQFFVLDEGTHFHTSWRPTRYG